MSRAGVHDVGPAVIRGADSQLSSARKRGVFGASQQREADTDTDSCFVAAHAQDEKQQQQQLDRTLILTISHCCWQ